MDNLVAAFPPWLIAGITLGVVASIIVAAVFVAADRLFPPDRSPSREPGAGSERRRIEIREYLRGIDEPYVEDYEVHGRRVAFYLSERDVAITFDAQTYFLLGNQGTQAVLCEHEMPGHHLGYRLPFEVPEPQPDREDTDPVRVAFERLDLVPTANEDAIRTAYRERIKEVHPDHGGDPDSFAAVQEAYTRALAHAERTGRRAT